MAQVRAARKSSISLSGLAVYTLPPFLISFLFYLLSPNEISWVQLVLAFLLLQTPWIAYLKWRKRAEEKLPIFALIAFMYWIYYALALFWGARTPSGVDTAFENPVQDESITWSLAMAVIGVAAIWLGMKVRLGERLSPNKLPELRQGVGSSHYLRFLLVAGALLSFSESLPFIAGEGARQVLMIIISTVPVLAFAILFRNVLSGEAELIDKLLVLGFMTLRLLTGLSSGWLGSFASLIIVGGAIFIAEKRKIPRFALLLVIVFTLFFQVGKQEFRKVYWKTDTETSKIDRVKFWTETSLSKWKEAVSDPGGGALVEAINLSLTRVSLLTQTANVIDLTPSVVPYQGGQLYSYLVVTWIPRALWPDKPSMNEANQFYQVTYGMTTEESAENVSIGVGVMTESYISFGWYGVAFIMFLMGIFYDVVRKNCFTNTSGSLMTALGIALLPQMISIESQMAAYLGGVVQQVVLILLIFLPIIVWKPQQQVVRFSSVLPADSGAQPDSV